jgi:hypothetical protein
MGHFFSSICGGSGGEVSWTTAFTLSFFLGIFGADRFYFNCICTGLIKLLLIPISLLLIGLFNVMPPLNILSPLIGTAGFLGAIGWWIYDFVRILLGKTICSGYYYKNFKGVASPLWKKKLEDANSSLGIK